MEAYQIAARFGPLPLPSPEAAGVFVALLLAWGLIEALSVLKSELSRGRLGLNTRSVDRDRGSSLGIAVGIAAGMTLAFVVAGAGWPIGAAWVQWLGLAWMAVGIALRVFSILWLGTMFTRVVQILPDHRLVTTGPYRFMRHPSYSGMMLAFLGMGLALGSWLSVVALLLLPGAAIAYRIRVEERALLAAFGDEYRVYMDKVRRLVPFVI